MQNLNEKNNPDKQSDPTPLGLDEMNSVIKSFQDSSFNTEELYNKNEKVFVKKTLYDLAIESEKKPSNEGSDIEGKKIKSENITEDFDEDSSDQLPDDKKTSSELQSEVKDEKSYSENSLEEKIDHNEKNEEAYH